MNGITLNELGSLGEFIGAIAVVASLIYVGIQLRQNTAAIKITTAQAFTDTWNGYISTLNLSPQLADIFYRGLTGTSQLKGGELIQFYAFLSQAFTTYQSFFLQRQKGVVDEGSWTSYVHAILDLMASKGVREYWEWRHHWYTKEFQDHVNTACSREAPHQMYPGLTKPER
jgi:hypothetical protein